MREKDYFVRKIEKKADIFRSLFCPTLDEIPSTASWRPVWSVIFGNLMFSHVLTKEQQNNGQFNISVGQPIENIEWLMIKNI